MEKSPSLNEDGSTLTRESIIGLGEASFRKNYYPALQKKIADLERLNDKYKTLIETIPDILLTYDSGALSVFSTLPENNEPIIREMLNDASISDLLESAVKESQASGQLVSQRFSFNAHGTAAFFEARANCKAADTGLIIIRDVTAEAKYDQQLKQMALRDSLTGLCNRTNFESTLSDFIGKPCENMALLLFDLDGLKIINDTLGHLSGDKVLISMADLLRRVFHEAKCIARIGGDEFGLLLFGYTQDYIDSKLKALDTAIREYNSVSMPLSLSISSGYSYLASGVPDLDLMFREADNKMYQNKLLKENSNRSSIVKTLMKTLEAKDFITEGHVQRMEQLAVIIGKALMLPQDKMDRIELLAKFHDIGKVGIPDSILMKQGTLNGSEWEVMKSHSGIGKRIAEVSPELRDISELILLHHERWDGTGYPLGLRETDIPIECRILSIVDAFDAMTNDRPYRKAMTTDAALAELLRCSGTQFDAKLVSIFTGEFPNA